MKSIIVIDIRFKKVCHFNTDFINTWKFYFPNVKQPICYNNFFYLEISIKPYCSSLKV